MEITQEALAEMIGEAVKGATEHLAAPAVKASDKVFDGDAVEKRTPKHKFGALARCVIMGGGDQDKAVDFAKAAYGDESIIAKTLATNDFDAGGAFVDGEMADEIIEPLRAASVVRRFNPRTVQTSAETFALPRMTSDAGFTWAGENEEVNASEPDTNQIVMTMKEGISKVPVSQRLLRAGGSGLESFISTQMVARMAQGEDQAFIRGLGTAHSPKGMRHWAKAANVSATNGTSAANIEDDFTDLLEAVEGSNVNPESGAFLMSSRSKNHLVNLRDGNGNLIYPEIRKASPTIHGYRVGITNNIPNNLGGGTETELYFANFSNLVIAEGEGIMVRGVTDTAYKDSSGTLVSTTDKREVLLMGTLLCDFAVEYTEAIAVKTGVTWGA